MRAWALPVRYPVRLVLALTEAAMRTLPEMNSRLAIQRPQPREAPHFLMPMNPGRESSNDRTQGSRHDRLLSNPQSRVQLSLRPLLSSSFRKTAALGSLLRHGDSFDARIRLICARLDNLPNILIVKV